MFFDKLPSEIFQKILIYLDPRDAVKKARINKAWYTHVNDVALWKIYLEDIAGKSYCKSLQDKSSYKAAYIHITETLPEKAQQLLAIIKFTEEKLEQYNDTDIENNDWDCLLDIVKKIAEKQLSPYLYAIIKYLLLMGHDFTADAYITTFYRKPFYSIEHILAAVNETESLVLLAQYGRNVDICGPNNYTPLHIAVSFDHFEVVATLKKLGANLSVESDNEGIPMEYAALHFKHHFLEPLYVDKRDKVDWFGKVFSDYLISTFEHEEGTFNICSDTPIDFRKIYRIKNGFKSSASREEEINQCLKETLSKEEYSAMKTVDFFINKDWPVPDWLQEVLFTTRQPDDSIRYAIK